MYKKIFDPNTKKYISIFTKKGKNVLMRYMQEGGILELSPSKNSFIENTFPQGFRYKGFKSLPRGTKKEVDLIFKILMYFGLFNIGHNNNNIRRKINQSKCKYLSNREYLELTNYIHDDITINKLLNKGSVTVLGSGGFGPAMSFKCDATGDKEFIVKIPYPFVQGIGYPDSTNEILNLARVATSQSPFINQFSYAISIKNKSIIFNDNGTIMKLRLMDLLNNDPSLLQVENNFRNRIKIELQGIQKSSKFGNYAGIILEKGGSNHENIIGDTTNAKRFLEKAYSIPIKNNTTLLLAALLTYIVEVSLGLYHIHKLGYVHCDFHPGNRIFNKVKLRSGLNVGISQLIDFGLLKSPGIWKPKDPTNLYVNLYREHFLPDIGQVNPLDKQINESDMGYGRGDTHPPEYQKHIIHPKGDVFAFIRIMAMNHLLTEEFKSLGVMGDKYVKLLLKALKSNPIERSSSESLAVEAFILLKDIGLPETELWHPKYIIEKSLALRGIFDKRSRSYFIEDNAHIFLNDNNFPKYFQNEFMRNLVPKSVAPPKPTVSIAQASAPKPNKSIDCNKFINNTGKSCPNCCSHHTDVCKWVSKQPRGKGCQPKFSSATGSLARPPRPPARPPRPPARPPRPPARPPRPPARPPRPPAKAPRPPARAPAVKPNRSSGLPSKCYKFTKHDKAWMRKNKKLIRSSKKLGEQLICEKLGHTFTRGKNDAHPGCGMCWCCTK